MEENSKIEDITESEILIVDSSAVIQRKIRNVLYSNSYCGLCFEESTELHTIYSQFEIIGDFGIHNIMLKDVISYVFKNEVKNMAKPYICSKCLDQIYNSYLFLYNTDHNLSTIYQYIDELKSRVCEVKEVKNLEKISIMVHHDEISETEFNSYSNIIVSSGFKCCKCEITLDSFEDLKKHENNHKWKYKIECKICKQTVYHRGYNKHLKSKHRDQVFSCMYCSLAFLTKTGYNCHLKRHINHTEVLKTCQDNIDGQLRCDLCYQTLDKTSFKTHKCQYSCTECDMFQCIHYEYLLHCRSQIANHTQIKCPETPCEYKCKIRQQLIGHLNREHLDYHPYTCDICKQEFYTKISMKNHIILYHQETYICIYCCKDFSKEKDMYKTHLNTCKDIKREFNCDDCEASFDARETLIDHEIICRKFHCTLCNAKFSKEHRLSEHRTKVHNGVQIVSKYYHKKPHNPISNDIEMNTCDICKSQHSNRKAVSLHKRNCHRQVKCTECGKIFNKGNIKAHMYSKHAGEQAKFTCEFCGEVFKQDSILKRHIQRHTEPVKCPECSKLIHQGRMQRHLKYHSRKKLQIENNTTAGFQCNQCEYKTQSSGSLEAHNNQVHLKIRPYSCEKCGKTFCGKFDLVRHMESHTRSKQKICEVCSITLVNNRSYNKHMSLHTGIKPHKCDQCTEGFHSIGELNNHRTLKHLGKFIACPIPHCKAMFPVMTHMRIHFKKVHWKRKDKAFDPKEVKGLHERYYHLFEDKRRRQIVED